MPLSLCSSVLAESLKVTDEVEKQINEGLKGVPVGIFSLFIKVPLASSSWVICVLRCAQHTSAALSLNENYDSDVRCVIPWLLTHLSALKRHRTDMTMALDKIVPESLPWRHLDEGPDDSASHTKASLIGSTISCPISNGKLNLGTWCAASFQC